MTSIPSALLLGIVSDPATLWMVCGLGLVLGMRHSTDADHVVALSTIVSRQRSIARATLIGALWGVGHTITIVLVGALIILLHVTIPTRLGLAMEFSVGVMLVVLGLLNLTGTMQRVLQQFGMRHTHGSEPAPVGETGRLGRFHILRPIFIGLVHGLAGSAAVALLVMSTIRDPRWAIAYLGIFGLGTIVGMMLMTTAIALPLTFGIRRFPRWDVWLVNASGVISLCFGLLVVYQLGYRQGLFTHTPHWTPQ